MQKIIFASLISISLSPFLIGADQEVQINEERENLLTQARQEAEITQEATIRDIEKERAQLAQRHKERKEGKDKTTILREIAVTKYLADYEKNWREMTKKEKQERLERYLEDELIFDEIEGVLRDDELSQSEKYAQFEALFGKLHDKSHREQAGTVLALIVNFTRGQLQNDLISFVHKHKVATKRLPGEFVGDEYYPKKANWVVHAKHNARSKYNETKENIKSRAKNFVEDVKNRATSFWKNDEAAKEEGNNETAQSSKEAEVDKGAEKELNQLNRTASK